MRLIATALLFAASSLLSAQTERVSLAGHEVAVYNLVGTLKVEGGSGDNITVEVTRAGREGARLKLETGMVRGRMTLRVRYPEDRIQYSERQWNGRSSFSISDDGTFGDNDRGNGDRRRIEYGGSDPARC